jgi:hypothetical protein
MNHTKHSQFTDRLAITLVILAMLTLPLLAQGSEVSENASRASDNGQKTTGSDARMINFAGWEWVVKSGCGRGPGPNCWSDSEQSVWVDEGQLHLKIREIDGTWNSAEVYSRACTRYGKHRFFVVGRVDNLDKNVVAAMFLYKDDLTEIDIEFAKWGEEHPSSNAQYVVQPWDTPGNREPFSMTLNGTHTTHYIDWGVSTIQFRSIHGHYQEPPDAVHLIHEWLYAGEDVPAQEACLRIHINLWMQKGQPPSDGQEVEIVVSDAQFPSPVYLPIIMAPGPWVEITANETHAWGKVGPSSFCNANYKVALYAKTDMWYVQPYDDHRRDIKIDPDDCTWESFTHTWFELAAHLVPASYRHPSWVGRPTPPCPPLDPAANPKVLAASCYR